MFFYILVLASVFHYIDLSLREICVIFLGYCNKTQIIVKISARASTVSHVKGLKIVDSPECAHKVISTITNSGN